MIVRAVTVLAIVAPLIAACGGDTSRTFGLTRDPPDEFMVTTRAPLSLPPEFALRPPRPGAPRPQEIASRDAAANLLAARTVTQPILLDAPAGASPGELALLAAAGPPTPADLRRQIEQETTLLAERDRSFVDRILFWRTPDTQGTAVDARAEAARLREAAALGREPTVGQTPVIQRRQRGLLEGLF